jgi:hypothetical protein
MEGAQLMGTLEILNVGAGDVKISYDRNDAAEAIRARRIVTDMLRRGYALLVEMPDGKMQRVLEFDEQHGEYIVADLDPVKAEATVNDPELRPGVAPSGPVPPNTCACGRPARHRGACKGRRRRMPMESTRATAVAPSAGG